MRVALLLVSRLLGVSLAIAVVACGPTARAVEEERCTAGEIRACGVGVCTGEQLCEGGIWSACYADGVPGTETCDGLDNDCDGIVDNGDNPCGGACAITGTPGDTCDGEDGDLCAEGVLECTSPNTLACTDTTGTRVELCGDGTDDNCDGRTDEYCAAKTVRWSDHGSSPVVASRARAKGVAIDVEGNVYVAGAHDRALAIGGAMTPDVGARTDGVIVKYSPTGALIWIRAIEGPGDAEVTAIALAPDGTIVAGGSFGAGSPSAAQLGSFAATPIGGNDVFVARYSATGDVLAATSFGSDQDDDLIDLDVSPSGGIAIAGRFLGPVMTIGAPIPRAGFNATPFVARLDAALAPVFVKRIEFAGPSSGDASAAAVAFAGEDLIAGGNLRCFTGCNGPRLVLDRGGPTEAVMFVGASFRAGYVARFDASGALLAAVATPQVNGLAVSGTTLYATGELSGTEVFAPNTPQQTTLVAKGQADAWLARYDLSLQLAWAKQFGSASSCGGFGVASDDAALAIAIDGDTPVVAGTHHQTLELAPDLALAGSGWGNIYWAGFDGAGAVAWGHNGRVGEQPCSGGGRASAIAVAPNGDIAIVGEFTPLLILPSATLAGAINTTSFFVAVFAK